MITTVILTVTVDVSDGDDDACPAKIVSHPSISSELAAVILRGAADIVELQ